MTVTAGGRDAAGVGPGVGPGSDQVWTKPILVSVSHAIEQFAVSAAPEQPVVVVAMFQRLVYFAREVEVYRRIADRALATVVGVTELFPPGFALGVSHTLLGAREPLSREWSVTVLGPRTGATLVARDLETVTGTAASLESGRQFVGGWSFRRDDAHAQLQRIRAELGDRLGRRQNGVIDEMLAHVPTVPADPDEPQWAQTLQFAAAQIQAGEQRGDHYRRLLGDVGADGAAGPDDGRDPESGLRTPAFLTRWTAGAGGGTLPVGLLLLRVSGLGGLEPPARGTVVDLVARLLGEAVTDADLVVRAGEEDFLLVLPGPRGDGLVRLHRRLAAAIPGLTRDTPCTALSSHSAALLTRTRPLPVQQMIAELDDELATTVSSGRDRDPGTGTTDTGPDGAPHPDEPAATTRSRSGSLLYLR